MSLLKLRDYQAAAVEAVRRAWSDGVRRPAVVLPTGAGKTVVFAHLVAIMSELGVRSVILAHRDELIEQAAAKLRAVAPDLRVGILKAGRREIRGRDVVVASVQSLTRPARRAELAAAGPRLVVVDECHHAVATTYVEVLRALGAFEDDPLVGAYAVGVTATLGRSDRIALGQVWQEVAYRQDIVTMIRQGHLVNAKGVRVRVEGLDLSRVRRMHGDFADKALAEAMHASLAPAAIARAYVEHAKDRSGVLFAPGVAMAYEMAQALCAEGVSAVGIDGTTALGERRRILAAHARGELQVICNAMVLTEGWDAPWCSAVVIARPTSSAPLFVQMAGRCLRPYPGKRDAMIIDVVGVTGRHRLASIADLSGAERVEKLDDELAQYEPDEEVDLLGLLDPSGPGRRIEESGMDGPLTSEIVDLFGTSRQAWLRTMRGAWFLPAGDSLIFIAPYSSADVGRYSVGRCPARTAGGEWVREDLDLDMAMSWGEQCAADAVVLTRRSAAWRKAEPKPAQLAMAAGLGATLDARATRGDVSDAISAALASLRLDPMPCLRNVTDRGYW